MARASERSANAQNASRPRICTGTTWSATVSPSVSSIVGRSVKRSSKNA